jgi:hypothetical protein
LDDRFGVPSAPERTAGLAISVGLRGAPEGKGNGVSTTTPYVASTAARNMRQDVKTAQPAPGVPGQTSEKRGLELLPHVVTPGNMVIRVVQANCRRLLDCTTTLLNKATKKAEVVLLPEFWADKRDPDGI